MKTRTLPLLIVLLLAACAGEPDRPRAASGGAPFTMGEAGGTLAGTVAELVPAGGYLYVRVETAAGPRWVASLKKPLHLGDAVRVRIFAEREDFASKRTGRVFERLVFGLITRS